MNEQKFKTPAEALQEHNTTENQEIKRQFVNREIHACISNIINIGFEEAGENFINFDEFTNLYCYNVELKTTGFYGELSETERGTETLELEARKEAAEDRRDDLEAKRDDLDDEADEIEFNQYDTDAPEKIRRKIRAYDKAIEALEKLIDDIDEDLDTLENADPEMQEIYEYWLVSGYLADKLDALGHPIEPDYHIWGRCTTGQAILLDYAIGKICADMEILNGQRYAWNAPKPPARIEINQKDCFLEVETAPDSVEIYINDYDAENPETEEKPNKYRLYP